MCGAEGMFGAQAAMSIGSAFLGAQGDTRDYNRRMNALNTEADAVNKSVAFKYALSQLQETQAQNRAAIEAGEKIKAGREAVGTASAGAASSGVEGNSVQALLTAFDVSTGNDVSNVFLQRDNEITQARMEQRGFQMDADARLTSLRQQVPDDPSTRIMARFLNSALQVGGAFVANSTPDKSALLGRRFG